MKWIRKKWVLMIFAIANGISVSVHACWTYGYGTIGSYLFGTVLQEYSQIDQR